MSDSVRFAKPMTDAIARRLFDPTGQAPDDAWAWRGAAVFVALCGSVLCALIALGVLVLAADGAAGTLSLAAMVAASLLAVAAVAVARLTPARTPPGVETTFSVEEPSTAGEAPSVILDRNGAIVEMIDHDVPCETGEPLLDRVHLADRIALMRAMSSLRTGDCRKAMVHLRFNTANRDAPQCFGPACVTLWPDRGARIAARIALGSADTGEPSTADISLHPGPESPSIPDQQCLATVSHELRTPLSAIIGFSDILRGGSGVDLDAEKRAEYVDLIHGAAAHLLSVVNAVLDVSRIEAGHHRVAAEPFDLTETVREAAAMVAPAAKTKAIHVNMHLDDKAPSAIADRRVVKQIVINLMSNAVKFTPEGGCVTVDGHVGDQGLSITISDTGIGIAADDLERIGVPFAQIDNSYTRHADGTGLGLALIKSLVERHGGTMQINSTPDIGTSVRVTLPAPVDDADAPAPRPSGAPNTVSASAATQQGDQDNASRRYG